VLSKTVNKLIDEIIEELSPNKSLENVIIFKNGNLFINSNKVSLDKKIHFLGVGKSASYEILAMKNYLYENGVYFKEGHSISITKEGHCVNDDFLELEGSHPILSKKNIKNTKSFISKISDISKDDTVFFFLSGGGSSLLELPKDGIEEEELISKYIKLVHSASNISDINRIRKKYSKVKNGGLLKFIKSENIFQFLTCDIPS
jgi:glycerate-2-kinase